MVRLPTSYINDPGTWAGRMLDAHMVTRDGRCYERTHIRLILISGDKCYERRLPLLASTTFSSRSGERCIVFSGLISFPHVHTSSGTLCFAERRNIALLIT